MPPGGDIRRLQIISFCYDLYLLPKMSFCHYCSDEFGSDWGLEDKDLEELVREDENDLPQLTLDSTAPPAESKLNQPQERAPDVAAPKPAEPAADRRDPLAAVPQEAADSASVVSEMISRLKQNLSEQAGSWWRISMMNVANRPLLASYETSSKEMLSSTSEIQDELAPVRHPACKAST